MAGASSWAPALRRLPDVPVAGHRVPDGSASGLKRQVGELLSRRALSPVTNALPFQYAMRPFVVAYQKRVGDW